MAKSSTSFQKGHKIPIEWREKISKANKGNTAWNKNMKGYKCPERSGDNHFSRKEGFVHPSKGKQLWKNRMHPRGMLGKVAWNKDKKTPIETRLKLSVSHLGQIAWNKGLGNGRTYSYYPSIFTKDWFRETIKKRDNYQCQGCGITEEEHIVVFGHKLCLHHIDYNTANCEPLNLVTVCKSCNTRAEHNKPYWQEFYSDKVKLNSKTE